MKKNLWLAALVGVALTGCVNDENSPLEEQSKKVAFTSVQSTQSRANFTGEIAGAIYPEEESFTVFSKSYKGTFKGWKYDDQNNNETYELLDFFDPAGESTTKKGEHWSTTLDHYWPSKGYALAFAAYSPSELEVSGVEVKYDDKGLQINDFEVSPTLDDQYDLMYAPRIYDQTYQNHGSSPVSLTFRHALTSIVFSITKGTTTNNKRYTVNNLWVTGDYIMQGDFAENLTEDLTNGYTQTLAPKWNIEGITADACRFEPSGFSPVLVEEGQTKELTKGKSALLLIPQDVPGNATLHLSFTVEELGTDAEGNPTVLKTFTYEDYDIPLLSFVDGNQAQITEWGMSYRYIYEVNFGGTKKIEFTPSVEQWIPGGTYSFTIQ